MGGLINEWDGAFIATAVFDQPSHIGTPPSQHSDDKVTLSLYLALLHLGFWQHTVNGAFELMLEFSHEMLYFYHLSFYSIVINCSH